MPTLPASFEDRLALAEERLATQKRMLQPPTDNLHLATLGVVRELVGGVRWERVDAIAVGAILAKYGVVGATTDPDYMALIPDTSGLLSAAELDNFTPAAGKRILLIGQTDKTQNGLYDITEWTADGAWKLTRAEDANTADEFFHGKTVYVSYGDTQAGKSYRYITETAPVVFGTTELEFNEYIQAALDEDQILIEGTGVPFDINVTHELNTTLVTSPGAYAVDDGSLWKFGIIPVDNSTVRVVSGVDIDAGKRFTLLLRGRLV